IDDLRMRRFDRGKIRRAAVGLKEAVHHGVAAAGGQIQRQAFAAAGLVQLREHVAAVGVAAVDLVDDDDPAQLALARELHEALRERVDAVHGTDHDGHRLHRLEHRQRLAEEVRIAGRVDEVDVDAVEVEAADRGVERVLQAPPCGSKSDTVLPRARLPRLRIAPACSSSVSTSEVLPAPACPTSAMLRMPDVVYPMADAPRHVGPAPHEHHRYGKSLLRKGCPRLLAARTMQGKMSDFPPDEARKRRAWQKIQRQLDEALDASFP